MQELDTLNVIIAGHIDHGKTTLLYKLTGKRFYDQPFAANLKGV